MPRSVTSPFDLNFLMRLNSNSFVVPRPATGRQEREAFHTVATRTNGPRTVVAATQKARVRTTKWNLGGLHRDLVLSIPEMIFFVCLFRGGFENLYAFFLSHPYTGALSPLLHSIFPNSDNSGWVCMGRNPTRDAITQETLRHGSTDAKINTVLTAFWQESYFNEDLMARFSNHAPFLHPDLANIAAWERASRLRPGFIHDVPWEFAATAGAVFDQLRRGR